MGKGLVEGWEEVTARVSRLVLPKPKLLQEHQSHRRLEGIIIRQRFVHDDVDGLVAISNFLFLGVGALLE